MTTKYKIGEIYLGTEPEHSLLFRNESFNYIVKQITDIESFDNIPAIYKINYYSPNHQQYLWCWESEKTVEQGKKLLEEYTSGRNLDGNSNR